MSSRRSRAWMRSVCSRARDRRPFTPISRWSAPGSRPVAKPVSATKSSPPSSPTTRPRPRPRPWATRSLHCTRMPMVRVWFEARAEDGQRDKIITTIYSHPAYAACAKVVGYKVITLYPDADGYPDLAAMQAAVGPRTAALVITNPEDTGIFNPRIAQIVQAAHDAGALACYDQANANGLLGITRARDAGFDLCHFNLHKTFATPHACGGPAVGACAVTQT